jgi:hypothetical protein
MSKFNTQMARPVGRGPITSERIPSTRTAEGAPGCLRDTKSELFLLAVTNMVGENTFYETAADRDSRYTQLIAQVATTDPEWTTGFLGWLRTGANMRSASLVGALEAAYAMIAAGVPGSRQIINSALQRADEPGEALAYWATRHGRRIPKPVKRGIADAVRRLYNERSLLKYDTASHGYRFADVLDLTHPTPTAPWQAALFKAALERRHGRSEITSLPMLDANAQLRRAATSDPAVMLNPEALRAAGMTWEDALSLVGSKVDKAKLWEAMIPSMGYMALLRNLRNFDQAGVSDAVALGVQALLADPAEVAKSRQLPMRFLSAYRAAPSLRWAYPLEQALNHCLSNIPQLSGRTLILVDTSGSMRGPFSKDGVLLRWDAAATFGITLGSRCETPDVVSFSSARYYYSDPAGARTKLFGLRPGESVLRSVERWDKDGYFLDGGTDTPGALRKHFAGHDRVVVLTDEQDGCSIDEVNAAIPASVPMYTWNLAGYRVGSTPNGPNRHAFGGLTDAGFRMIPLLEAGRDGAWPWL